jgi:hypothetical protein
MIPLLAALTLTAAPADSLLVTTAWLAERLGDTRLVLFQIGARTEYDSAHIAGAQYLQLSDISAPRDSLLPLELPAPAALDSVLEARGVSDDCASRCTGAPAGSRPPPARTSRWSGPASATASRSWTAGSRAGAGPDTP